MNQEPCYDARIKDIEANLKDIGSLLNEILVEVKGEDISLTAKQAAFYLGCTPDTIRNYLASGVLRKEVNGDLEGYTKNQLKKIKIWKRG